MQHMTLAEVQIKITISDLNGSLGSRQFLNVPNERTCFALGPPPLKNLGSAPAMFDHQFKLIPLDTRTPNTSTLRAL